MLDPLLCHLPAKCSKPSHMHLPTSHFGKGSCKNLHVAEFEANTFLGKEHLSALCVVGWVVRLPSNDGKLKNRLDKTLVGTV